MKKLLSLICALMMSLPVVYGAELTDTVSVARVFAESKSKALNILGASTRLDMLDYAKAGTEYSAVNEMYGKSSITSFSERCINVEISQVTTAQIFTLPTTKGGIAAIIYTVDDGGADSQIEFFTPSLSAVKAGKHFTAPLLRDFIAPQYKKDKGVRNKVEAAVPFIAMRYVYEPADETLRAILTLSDLVSGETLKEVTPYLLPFNKEESGPTLSYKWNGTKFLINKH